MDDEEFRELTHELGGLTHFVHQVIQKSNLDLFKIHEHNRTIQKDVMAAEASVAHAVNKIAEREQDAREEQGRAREEREQELVQLTADQTEEDRAKCLAQFREACRELLQRQRVEPVQQFALRAELPHAALRPVRQRRHALHLETRMKSTPPAWP